MLPPRFFSMTCVCWVKARGGSADVRVFDRVVAAQGRGGSAGLCKCNIFTSARLSHFLEAASQSVGWYPLGYP